MLMASLERKVRCAKNEKPDYDDWGADVRGARPTLSAGAESDTGATGFAGT
jgi:hypothetical protein